MHQEHVVQAISGGMDSTCLCLHHLAKGRAVSLISFDYGQRHRLELDRLDRNLELFAEKHLAVRHTRLAVPFGSLAASALTEEADEVPRGFYEDENMKQTVVPNRNAIFTALLYCAALSDAKRTGEPVTVSLGVHAGDHAIYPDCRVGFYEKLFAAFALGNWDSHLVGFELPYINSDKTDILRDGKAACDALGLSFAEVLGNTSTSYAPTPDGLADGRTGSDVERILAFRDLGEPDPVPYVGGWEKALAYAEEVETRSGGNLARSGGN